MFSTLYARATGWLSFHHLERRIALTALVFALPSLAIGLQYDDYLLHDQLMKGGPFAAYLFTPQGARASNEQFLEQRVAGEMPWWADEHVQTRFFRPLSSLSLWLGFAHGAPPWWMHLENCVIYAVIAWLAVVIYKQLGLTGAGLGWAALFFGLDMGLATTVGWIAGRNTLLAVCFGFACIALHDRARRNGRPALQIAACVCFVLSLLSAELGLCTLGYLFAYTITVDRASPARRGLVVLPYAALTGVYLAHYVASGYGTTATYLYRNVVGSPATTLLAWIESIPVWLATTATLPVATLQAFVPGARAPISVMSVVVVAFLLRLCAARWREQPAAGVLGGGAVLSLVPLATMPALNRSKSRVATPARWSSMPRTAGSPRRSSTSGTSRAIHSVRVTESSSHIWRSRYARSMPAVHRCARGSRSIGHSRMPGSRFATGIDQRLQPGRHHQSARACSLQPHPRSDVARAISEENSAALRVRYVAEGRVPLVRTQRQRGYL